MPTEYGQAPAPASDETTLALQPRNSTLCATARHRERCLILSFNFYYAHPGLADAVLRQRLRACEVRQSLGLPRGRVFSRMQGSEALPEVIWELEFAAIEGHLRDMEARAASAEFEAVRAGMRKLCRRFERPLFEVDDTPLPAPSSSDEAAFAVLEWVYCAPDTTASIAAALRAAAESSQRPMSGSTLARLITDDSDLPQLVWKREYARGRAPTSLAEDAPCARTSAWADLPPHLPHRRAGSVWTVC